MSQYSSVKLNISDGQKEKLQRALKSMEKSVSIKLGYEDLNGNDVVALTKTQINRLAKAYQNHQGLVIKLSPAQLKHNLKVEGGVLPILAGLGAVLAKTVLPALGVGALSGLASTGVQKALGNGLYLKKGKGVCQVETDGKGLYLSPMSGHGLESHGNGLYLRQGGQMVEGSGLLLGPNSPLKNIPVLGWLL